MNNRPILHHPAPRYRLGFPVKILGANGLRSHDSRRWQNQPHLSISLAYLRDIFEYLKRQNIHFYRMAGHLAPYLTHPAFPQFHQQIEECTTELAAIGDLARDYGIRLTMHPGHYIQLSSPNHERVARSADELNAAARLLEAMGLGPEAVLVIHIGGSYEESQRSRERFIRNFDALPSETRHRLALENDDVRFSLQDTLWVHRRTGIRLVLDTLHHRCLNPMGCSTAEALALALATWPTGQRPKIHLSSSRTAVRQSYRQGQVYIHAPLPNQHSDFIHPFEFMDLIQAAQAAKLRPFDIMLEAKAKELALLRLREQIERFGKEFASLVT